MSIHLQSLLKRKQVCPSAIFLCRSTPYRQPPWEAAAGESSQEFMGTECWQALCCEMLRAAVSPGGLIELIS